MSEKTLLYGDENFEVIEEKEGDLIFLHCYSYRFSPSVLRIMRKVFSEIKEGYREGGVTRIFSYTPNFKFASLLGGEQVNAFWAEGERYGVFLWDLKQQQC